MHIFKNPNFDFVRWKWHAIAISWVIILIGAFLTINLALSALMNVYNNRVALRGSTR